MSKIEFVFTNDFAEADKSEAANIIPKLKERLEKILPIREIKNEPPQVIYTTEKFFFYGCSAKSAIDQGMTLKPETEIFVLIDYVNSDFAKSQMEKAKSSPNLRMIEGKL